MSESRLKILNFAKTKEYFKSQELVDLLQISRQTVADHLRKLISEGYLIKSGSTQNATYRLRKENDPPSLTESYLTLIKKREGLQEDEVFDEVKRRMNLKALLNKNAFAIAQYSFSEMLNNAIDHSKSEKIQIEVWIRAGYFEFKIRDFGIGIFKNIQDYFHLENEYQGAEHLLKGKQTTMPSRHSGQGIFFTSRIADEYALQSHSLRVNIKNEIDDAYFADVRPFEGTLVEFKIKQKTKKIMKTLFDQFTADRDSFEFDKNILRVRLRANQELISRSQARRLLMGLEDYKVIIFDFKGMQGIGQAFADEIFRVYASQHPDKKIGYENAGPVVEFMIQRAQAEMK